MLIYFRISFHQTKSQSDFVFLTRKNLLIILYVKFCIPCLSSLQTPCEISPPSAVRRGKVKTSQWPFQESYASPKIRFNNSRSHMLVLKNGLIIQGGPNKSLWSKLQPKLSHLLKFCHILFLHISKLSNFC